MYLYIVSHLEKQIEFSKKNYDDENQFDKILLYLYKTVSDVKDNHNILKNWTDVIVVSLDGSWRTGHDKEKIANELNDMYHNYNFKIYNDTQKIIKNIKFYVNKIDYCIKNDKNIDLKDWLNIIINCFDACFIENFDENDILETLHYKENEKHYEKWKNIEV